MSGEGVGAAGEGEMDDEGYEEEGRDDEEAAFGTGGAAGEPGGAGGVGDEEMAGDAGS